MSTVLIGMFYGVESSSVFPQRVFIVSGQGAVPRQGAQIKSDMVKLLGKTAVRPWNLVAQVLDGVNNPVLQDPNPKTTSITGGFLLAADIPSLSDDDTKEMLGFNQAEVLGAADYRLGIQSLLPRCIRMVEGLGSSWPAGLTMGNSAAGVPAGDRFQANLGAAAP